MIVLGWTIYIIGLLCLLVVLVSTKFSEGLAAFGFAMILFFIADIILKENSPKGIEKEIILNKELRKELIELKNEPAKKIKLNQLRKENKLIQDSINCIKHKQ